MEGPVESMKRQATEWELTCKTHPTKNQDGEYINNSRPEF